MKDIVKKVSAVILSLRNVLERAHLKYGELTEKTAEKASIETMAGYLNENQDVPIGRAKLFMLSVRDLLLQLGRWENAGKVVWKAPAVSESYRNEDLSFMRRLPFGRMFVEGPVHAFGADAAGFFISAYGDAMDKFMITFVFMKDSFMAYSRSIEIDSARSRSRSLIVRYPETTVKPDGSMSWDFSSVFFRSIEEYDQHAVRAEQAALDILRAIYEENRGRCDSRAAGSGMAASSGMAAGSVGESEGGVKSSTELPDFRFFGAYGSGKTATSRKGHGQGTPKTPHPVPASPSHRWHRVPDNDMSLVTKGAPTKWRTLKHGEERLYQLLPSDVREYHTGKNLMKGDEKTPIRIRVAK